MALRFLVVATTCLTSGTAAANDDGECASNLGSEGDASCGASDPILVGLEWFLNPDHLPFVVAQKHGIFDSFGLQVELVEPTDHWEAGDEIAQGRLDVAVTEPLHLAQDTGKGEKVLGFMRFLHTDGGVMYNADHVQRPADMCGKTISYPGSPGPGGPAIVQTMVEADGKMDCDLESYGKYNGGFFHTQALEEGKADLATLIFWNFEIPEAQTRNNLNVSFFSLKDWGVPDFCQLVLMTTPERFRERKEGLRKLVLALRKATAVIHQNPQLAKDYYRQHVGADDQDDLDENIVLEATLTATLPAFPNDFMMATEYYQNLMQWLVDTNQVDSHANETSVSEYWTNEIAW